MFLERWRQAVRQLKAEIFTIYYAYRHPETPWYARLLAVVVLGYAFSPIDLIPDFVPVLGLLDDLILLPLGIIILRKLIPDHVMQQSRARASELQQKGKPTSWIAAVVIIAIWVALAILLPIWFFRFFS